MVTCELTQLLHSYQREQHYKIVFAAINSIVNNSYEYLRTLRYLAPRCSIYAIQICTSADSSYQFILDNLPRQVHIRELP